MGSFTDEPNGPDAPAAEIERWLRRSISHLRE